MTARPGAAIPGAARYGDPSSESAEPPVPEEIPDLDWSEDAPTPTVPPNEEPIVPEVAFELLTRGGSHVAWIDKGHELGWLCDKDSPGNAAITVQKDSPLLAELVPPRMLRVRYRGKVVQDALLGELDQTTYDDGEEADQNLKIVAPGHVHVFDDGIVAPWSSTSRPDSQSQRYSYAHPRYTQTPGWGHAAEIARADQATTFWTGLPRRWPAWVAYYIAGGSDTQDNAEPGHLYGRRKFVTESRMYAMCFSADNFLHEMCVDGVAVGETRDFQEFQRVDRRFTAGEHTFAAHWENEVRESGNPTYFIFSLHPIDSAGRLGDPVLVSDSSWWILDRPVNPPGWKVTQIVDDLIRKWEARSGLKSTGGHPIARTWTTLTDTKGAPASVVTDFTLSAKESIFDGLERLGETYIEYSMRPGMVWTLDLWNKGTRGDARDVDLGTGFDPVDDPCLTALDHPRQPPYATTIYGHLNERWVKRSRSVAGFYIERSLDLPNVLTREEAEFALDQLLDAFGRERVLYRAEAFPIVNAHRPHLSFHVADLVMMPDPDGVMTQVEMLTIAGVHNRDGETSFRYEAGDRLFTQQERVEQWLRRKAEGAFGGRTALTSSTPTELPRQLVRSVRSSLSFHRPTTVVDIESDPKRPGEASRIIEFPVTIGAAQGSDVEVQLLLDGTPVTATTVPAGSRWATSHLNIPIDKGVEDISVACSDTGFSIVAEVITE